MPRPFIKARRKRNAAVATRVAPVGREEFRRRRRALMKLMGRDCIAIVPTAPVRLRNNDVEYAYRPDSDFFYLTGFAEPESVAVLIPNRPQGEYILFVRDREGTSPRDAGPLPTGALESHVRHRLEGCDRDPGDVGRDRENRSAGKAGQSRAADRSPLSRGNGEGRNVR